MSRKLLAVFFAVFFIGLAGLMASVTFFVRDPIPVIGARAPLVVHQGDVADGLRATLAVDPTMRFELSGEDSRSSSPPGARLVRGQGGGGSIDIDLEDAGEGRWIGRGSFTAPGRWKLEFATVEGLKEFPFILQE